MAVYVDPIRTHATVKGQAARWGKQWCHMFGDTTAELDAMAVRVGLRTSYRQHSGKPLEHYDLTPPKRELAVKYGAIELTSREAIRRVVDPKIDAASPPPPPYADGREGERS